jgi:hypothetical protein
MSAVSTAIVAVLVSLATIFVGETERLEQDMHDNMNSIVSDHHLLDEDKKREMETVHLLEVEEKDAETNHEKVEAHDKIDMMKGELNHDLDSLLTKEHDTSIQLKQADKKNKWAHYSQAFFEISILLTSVANLTRKYSFLIAGLTASLAGGTFTILSLAITL